MSVMGRSLRNLSLGAAIVAGATVLATTAGTSAQNYDGVWSVVIITERGTCDRAYRYPIRILRGTVVNEGSSPATVTGKVSNNGAVSVTVSAGDKSATGSGRLGGTTGAGSWRGGDCSGTWEAERRGA